MPKDPSPNFDEHVTLGKTDSIGKGVLDGCTHKFTILDWMKKEGHLLDPWPAAQSLIDAIHLLNAKLSHERGIPSIQNPPPPNSIVFKESVLNGWKGKFPDFGEWAKEELKPEPKPKSFKDKILDSLNFRFESESEPKPTKMGKKKKKAEIERLKQVVERLEAEKDELKDKQLNLGEKQLHFDLEVVQGILARHGKVGVTVNEKNPEFFRDLNSHRTVVITLNC